jgi:hypothetical protein
MRTFEDKAQRALKNNVVLYVAVPVYATSKSTIPIGFNLSYLAQNPAGGIGASDGAYVSNDGQGLLPNLGN